MSSKHSISRAGRGAKLTAAAVGTSFSTWAVDGRAVVFRRYNLPFWAAADGNGQAGPVPSGTVNDYPSAPGPDADSILDVRVQPETSGDVFLLSITGRFQPKALLATSAYEGGAQLSPDGRWMVYQSNESGEPEIYIRRYPALDRAWQVSEGGGVQAWWSRTSREIYFRGGKNMMSATFDLAGADPIFGKPVALFADQYDIEYLDCELRRDPRRAVHHVAPGGDWRSFTRRDSLDGGAEACCDGRRRPLSVDSAYTSAPVDRGIRRCCSVRSRSGHWDRERRYRKMDAHARFRANGRATRELRAGPQV